MRAAPGGAPPAPGSRSSGCRSDSLATRSPSQKRRTRQGGWPGTCYGSLTFPVSPSLVWSMRPWESPRSRRRKARELLPVHGPAGATASSDMVNEKLTAGAPCLCHPPLPIPPLPIPPLPIPPLPIPPLPIPGAVSESVEAENAMTARGAALIDGIKEQNPLLASTCGCMTLSAVENGIPVENRFSLERPPCGCASVPSRASTASIFSCSRACCSGP